MMMASDPGKSKNGTEAGPTGRHCMLVTLSDEQLAAAEGWRAANGIVDLSEALGELVRLGLLSEIGRVYRLATAGRDADDWADEDDEPCNWPDAQEARTASQSIADRTDQ